MRLVVLLFVAGCCFSSCVLHAESDASGEWSAYGANNANNKYSPLSQINRANVHKLRIVWEWESPANEIGKQYPSLKQFIHESTPLMIDDVLYAATSLGQVAAIDPQSGRTQWVYDPVCYKVGRGVHGGMFIHRGVAYWSDGRELAYFLGLSMVA